MKKSLILVVAADRFSQRSARRPGYQNGCTTLGTWRRQPFDIYWIPGNVASCELGSCRSECRREAGHQCAEYPLHRGVSHHCFHSVIFWAAFFANVQPIRTRLCRAKQFRFPTEPLAIYIEYKLVVSYCPCYLSPVSPCRYQMTCPLSLETKQY